MDKASDEQEIEQALKATFYELHRHPELSYEEFRTTEKLRELLAKAGIRILSLPLTTGLVAEIGSGKPVIALRTDIDGLPVEEKTGLPYASEEKGKMHACGHDFHMSAVLGAAMLLKAREEELRGTVCLVFQPAEEAPGGAKVVLETGALDDVDAIFGLHVVPFVKPGTIGIKEGAVTASVDHFELYIRGKGTHAAEPQRGIDPIPVAAAFISGAQTIVSRRVSPFSSAVVSVTHVEAGNTWNVIPESAYLEGTARTLSKEDRAMVKEQIYQMADGLSKATNTDIEVKWYAGPPATANTAKWTALARKVAEESGIPVVTPQGWMAGEDFAFYQEKLPGAFLLVSTGPSPANHNPGFKVDPAAIFPTAKYLARLVEAAGKA